VQQVIFLTGAIVAGKRIGCQPDVKASRHKTITGGELIDDEVTG